MIEHHRRVQLFRWLLVAVLLLAVFLRVQAMSNSLPYIFHPDEPAVIRISRDVFVSGDLNPHFFDYPSLVFYGNALAYIPFYIGGRMAGEFDDRSDLLPLEGLTMGTVRSPQPAAILFNRGLSLIMGAGTVLLLYVIGRVLFDSWAIGLAGALLLALSPNHVYQSRIVTPDGMMTFFVVLALLGAALVLRQGKTPYYLLAGIAVGLAAGTKYNGAFVAITVAVAHFQRAGLLGWRDVRLYGAGVASVLTFLLTTPYAVLDYPAFGTALFGVGSHYSTGHPGMEGDTLAWYIGFLWATTTLVPLLAVIQIVRGVWSRWQPTLLLAVYPVIYFIIISGYQVRNDRTILPIIPFLMLLAAALLIDFLVVAHHAQKDVVRAGLTFVLTGLVIATVLYPLSATMANNHLAERQPSQVMAATWIAANLEPGARVAIESYSPFLEPTVYDVVGLNSLIDNPAEWYAAEGFNYVIASSGAFGRFYRDSARYADEVNRYDLFFDMYDLVQSFDDGLTEIRVYRVAAMETP